MRILIAVLAMWSTAVAADDRDVFEAIGQVACIADKSAKYPTVTAQYAKYGDLFEKQFALNDIELDAAASAWEAGCKRVQQYDRTSLMKAIDVYDGAKKQSNILPDLPTSCSVFYFKKKDYFRSIGEHAALAESDGLNSKFSRYGKKYDQMMRNVVIAYSWDVQKALMADIFHAGYTEKKGMSYIDGIKAASHEERKLSSIDDNLWLLGNKCRKESRLFYHKMRALEKADKIKS